MSNRVADRTHGTRGTHQLMEFLDYDNRQRPTREGKGKAGNSNNIEDMIRVFRH